MILLDLMMPRLNGYEFLESLESVRPDAHPVIIVMTAFESSSLRKLPPNRVHAILHKPFDVERAVELVRDCAFVGRQEGEASAADDPKMPPPLAAPSDEESPMC